MKLFLLKDVDSGKYITSYSLSQSISDEDTKVSSSIWFGSDIKNAKTFTQEEANEFTGDTEMKKLLPFFDLEHVQATFAVWDEVKQMYVESLSFPDNKNVCIHHSSSVDDAHKFKNPEAVKNFMEFCKDVSSGSNDSDYCVRIIEG